MASGCGSASTAPASLAPASGSRSTARIRKQRPPNAVVRFAAARSTMLPVEGTANESTRYDGGWGTNGSKSSCPSRMTP